MRVLHWEQFCGSSLDGEIELAELISSSPISAIFSGFETKSGQRTEVSVQVFEGADAAEADTLMNRFQEAKFLNHPNLLKLGRIGRDAGAGLVYVCSPRAESTLGQFIDARRLKPREAREFVSQIVSALSFLHAENMVFCNLRPTSVWKIGTAWLLADFSQMRLESRTGNKELRQVLTRQADVPPEAYEGIVSPAWDSWGLGVLIRTGMIPEPTGPESPAQRARQLRDVDLPAPFDTITRDCLEPDPKQRITLDEIKARLSGASLAPPLNDRLPAVDDALLRFEDHPMPDPRPAYRLWGLVAMGIVIFIAVLWAGGAIGHLSGPSSAEASKAPAISEADRSMPTPSGGNLPALSVTAGQAEVLHLLDQWSAAIRKKDAKALAALYAPVIAIYFDQKQVNRNQLMADKEREFRSITQVHLYELARTQYRRVDRNTAIVTFDRSWRFGGRDWSSGADQEQLTWELVEGAWRIASEREVKTYWMRNSKGEVR